jgi:uncharacterized membrane protein HdeD (DUF308 family)
MNIHTLKRVAAALNLIAAVIFISLGMRSGRTAYVVIGAVFLMIGILRIIQIRKGAPPG